MPPAAPDPDAADLPPRGSADIAGNTWDLAPFSPPRAGAEAYVYRNVYNLLPRSVARGGLTALKFFGNDVEVLPAEAADLDGLHSLQVKVSAPRVSGAVLRRMRALRELELSMVPPRPSACSVLVEIAGLKCLTKLTICHFSIRYARHHHL
jgi:hypothetical protein